MVGNEPQTNPTVIGRSFGVATVLAGFALLPVPRTFPWSKPLLCARAVGAVVRLSKSLGVAWSDHNGGSVPEAISSVRSGLPMPQALAAADFSLTVQNHRVPIRISTTGNIAHDPGPGVNNRR